MSLSYLKGAGGKLIMEEVIMELWVDLDDVARYLGTNKAIIEDWIAIDHFPAHLIGDTMRCKLSEVDAWVRAGTNGSRSTYKIH